MIASIVVLLVAMFSTLLTATNADYAIPALVDLTVFAAALGPLAFYRTSNALERRSVTMIAVPSLLLLAWIALRIGLAFRAPYASGAMLCTKMPAFLPRLECLLMQDFSQHYGVRQLTIHTTALALLLSGMLIGARYKTKADVLLFAFASFGLVAATIAILGIEGVIDRSPFFPLISTRHTRAWGTAVVANPGWLWPMLAPSLAAATAIAAHRVSGPKLLQACGVAAALFIMYACLGSRQRGSYLLIGVVAAGLGLCFLVEHLALAGKGQRRLAIAGALLFALGAGVFFKDVLTALGIGAIKDPLSISNERVAIWTVGLAGFADAPLFGHGYSSWMSEFAKLAEPLGLQRFTFATAHNFFVQSLFELGLVQSLAILGFWGSVAAHLVRTYLRKPSTGTRFGALLVMTALAVALVQEIDHVNTIYYQFALGIGLALGLASDTNPTSVASRPQVALASLGIPAAGFLIVAFLATQISWGGMAFGVAADDFRSFLRAFRPSGQVVAFPTKDHRLFSVFRMYQPQDVPKLPGRVTNDFDSFNATTTGLLLANSNSRAVGRAYYYADANPRYETQRVVAFSLEYPPLQTDLGVFGEQGLWTWENDAGSREAVRWCSRHCRFALKHIACAAPSRVELTWHRPRVDPAVWEPGAIDARIHTVVTPDEAREALQNMPNVAPVSLPTDAIGEPHALDLGSNEGWGWVIDISTNSPFVPKSIDIASTDERELSVKLLGMNCR